MKTTLILYPTAYGFFELPSFNTNEAFENVKNAGKRIIEEAGRHAETIQAEVQKRRESLQETMQEKGEALRETMQQHRQSLEESLQKRKEAMEESKEKLKEMWKEMKENAVRHQGSWEEGKGKMKKMWKELKNKVGEHKEELKKLWNEKKGDWRNSEEAEKVGRVSTNNTLTDTFLCNPLSRVYLRVDLKSILLDLSTRRQTYWWTR